MKDFEAKPHQDTEIIAEKKQGKLLVRIKRKHNLSFWEWDPTTGKIVKIIENKTVVVNHRGKPVVHVKIHHTEGMVILQAINLKNAQRKALKLIKQYNEAKSKVQKISSSEK